MYCNLWIHISSYQKTVLWVNIASYEVLMLLLNPHFDYKLCWMLWINLFFSTWVFFHGHWRLIGRHGTLPFFIPLYHFHLFANIQTFVCTFGCEMTITYLLIAPLVFTRLLLDEIYHLYRITIWLTDDVKLVFVCLHDDLILVFCYNNLDTGNRWTRIRIDYHPCITSEPTNQVC